ncbi:MAG TPA: hypothetical protein EYM70_02040 [Pelagibacteraceae bacterium]|nr:hypothetical protein [Pelagibacteraceae bacterium]
MEEVDWMRELYFVSSYKRSIRTIHFRYGFAGKNNIAGKRLIFKSLPSFNERTCRGVYIGNTLVFTPLFLERFLIRISQKTKSCLISRKFFGGNN